MDVDPTWRAGKGVTHPQGKPRRRADDRARGAVSPTPAQILAERQGTDPALHPADLRDAHAPIQGQHALGGMIVGESELALAHGLEAFPEELESRAKGSILRVHGEVAEIERRDLDTVRPHATRIAHGDSHDSASRALREPDAGTARGVREVEPFIPTGPCRPPEVPRERGNRRALVPLRIRRTHREIREAHA